MIPVNELLDTFVLRSVNILSSQLVGVYLHGSSVMGCFHPSKSDIDLILVVRSPLSLASKHAFMEMVVELNASAPAKGIEMSIVPRAVCRPFVYPTPFDLHFSPGHLKWYLEHPDEYLENMHGTDKDLAAHFTVIRKRGQCLWGAPIEEVFGEVPAQDYMDSLMEDIAGAKEEIAENTLYLTLNLARVLAYQREGVVLSKKEGGEWALAHLPPVFHPLVREALQEYAGSAAGDYNLALAGQYAEYMLNALTCHHPQA